MNTSSYGSWDSPLSARDLTKASLRLGTIAVDGDEIYWTEGRPEEKGRAALLSSKRGELLPKEYNVRTRVHEYGGGEFCAKEGVIYFSNDSDQALYRYDGSVTLFAKGCKFANGAPHKEGLYCVYEEGAENCIAWVTKDRVVKVATGHDFYTSPTISPDGTKIAFITWDVPQMPWDGSTLWVASINDDGTLQAPERVAGGPDESIVDPKWSPDGALHYASDKSGFWNLYREGTPLCPKEAEFGYPHWVFGISRYTFVGNQIAALYTDKGRDHLALIDPKTQTAKTIDLPFTAYGTLHSMGDLLVFTAADPKTPTSLYTWKAGELTTLQTSEKTPLSPDDISLPEEIAFPTTGNKTAYAFYYPPKNSRYKGPQNSLPPLIVQCHGGPTARASATLSAKVQYWTTRGFGYLDVNYGGSTGYGRAYRNRLCGNWGVVDIDDCTNAARYLAEQKRVDSKKLIIRGGSAGGYTTLAALAFRNTFAAGASYYGVADLEALASDSHKFEAHYLDTLIGPYPECKETYIARSPIHAVDKISCPMIILQGEEDKVVPPNQAEMMVEALRRKKLPLAYLLFPGEQHGFRRAENIIKAHEAELYFYSRIFHFDVAVPPIPIEN